MAVSAADRNLGVVDPGDFAAHGQWEGDLRCGNGSFDLTSSGTITGQAVTFASRFEPEAGGKTSPRS